VTAGKTCIIADSRSSTFGFSGQDLVVSIRGQSWFSPRGLGPNHASSARRMTCRAPWGVACPIFRGIHQRPKSGISFGSRNAAMTSRRWRTGSPLLIHRENKTQSSGQRVEAQALSSRIGNRAWSALMRRNRSLPLSPGISKSRTARSKAERSQRNACIGQLSNTTE